VEERQHSNYKTTVSSGNMQRKGTCIYANEFIDARMKKKWSGCLP
jgi:hypothetical protein